MAQIVYQGPEIDLSLKPTSLYEFEYISQGTSFIAYFDDNTTPDNIHLASFEVRNSNGTIRWINYKVYDGQCTTHVVDGATIRYNGVHPGMDIKYEVLEDRLKEYIFVDSAENYRPIMFTITSDGCRWVEENGAINFYDVDTDEQLWIIEKPFILGQDADVSISDSGLYEGYQTFTMAIENAQDLVYPLIIDPTTVTSTNTDRATVMYSNDYAQASMAVSDLRSTYYYDDWYFADSPFTSWGGKISQSTTIRFGTNGGGYSQSFVFKGMAHTAYSNVSSLRLDIKQQSADGTLAEYTTNLLFPKYNDNIVTYNDNDTTMYIAANHRTTAVGTAASVRLLSSTDGQSWSQIFATSSFNRVAGIYKDPADGVMCLVVNSSSSSFTTIKMTGATTYSTVATHNASYEGVTPTDGATFSDGNFAGRGSNVQYPYFCRNIYLNGNIIKAGTQYIYSIARHPTLNRMYFLIQSLEADATDTIRVGILETTSGMYIEQTVALTGGKTYFNIAGNATMSVGGGYIHLGATFSNTTYYDKVVDPWDGKTFSSGTENSEENIIDSTWNTLFPNTTGLTVSNTGHKAGLMIVKGAYPSEQVLFGGTIANSVSGNSGSTFFDSNYTNWANVYDTANTPYYITTLTFKAYNSDTFIPNLKVNEISIFTTTGTYITNGSQYTWNINKPILLSATDVITIICRPNVAVVL